MNWDLDAMKEKGVEDVAPTPTPSPAARTAHQTPDVSPALHASSATSALKPNNDDVSHSSKRSLPAYFLLCMKKMTLMWGRMIICWYLFNFLFNNYVCISISAY